MLLKAQRYRQHKLCYLRHVPFAITFASPFIILLRMQTRIIPPGKLEKEWNA